MLAWKKILVATDFSSSARVALRSAEALTRQLGGSVEVVHVLEPLPARYKMLIGSFGTPDLDRQREREAEKALARLLGQVDSSRVAVEGFVRAGKPWKEIAAAAEELEADLVCLGNSGHSRFERLLLGATAENVVRRSTIPVLVTRRRPLRKVDRVLVPVDFEPGSEAALRFALERCPKGVQIEAVFVVPPLSAIDPYMLNYIPDQPQIERDLRAFLDRCGARRVKFEVRMFGDPATEILRFAQRRRTDLILVSTHGRRGLARFLLGSVAEKVVRYAERPVLVLPGPGRSARTSR